MVRKLDSEKRKRKNKSKLTKKVQKKVFLEKAKVTQELSTVDTINIIDGVYTNILVAVCYFVGEFNKEIFSYLPDSVFNRYKKGAEDKLKEVRGDSDNNVSYNIIRKFYDKNYTWIKNMSNRIAAYENKVFPDTQRKFITDLYEKKAKEIDLGVFTEGRDLWFLTKQESSIVYDIILATEILKDVIHENELSKNDQVYFKKVLNKFIKLRSELVNHFNTKTDVIREKKRRKKEKFKNKSSGLSKRNLKKFKNRFEED